MRDNLKIFCDATMWLCLLVLGFVSFFNGDFATGTIFFGLTYLIALVGFETRERK